MGAASLQRIGFTAASDLVGGMHAWITADLPVEPADHSHLDF
jgi:rhodanese-related sulfurtransferase